MKKIIILKFSAILLVFSLLVGCTDSKQNRYSQMFFGLDTVITLIAYADDESQFNEYADFVNAELERYHQLFDRFNDYDGIKNVHYLNNNAYAAPVVVDQALIDVLLIYKHQSSPYVKMSLAPVSDLWRNSEGNLELPDEYVLNSIGSCVDDDAIVINEETNEVSFLQECTIIDLGAVAKGYIMEEIARGLEEMGLEHAILNGGGNVRTIGPSNQNQAWRIGVVDPDFPNDPSKTKLTLLIDHSTSVVTSGDYQRYFEVDGVRYHHILDPNTLQPGRNFRSVTVIFNDSGLADYYSTLLFLLPLKEGKDLVENIDGLEAIWILEDGTVIKSANVPVQ